MNKLTICVIGLAMLAKVCAEVAKETIWGDNPTAAASAALDIGTLTSGLIGAIKKPAYGTKDGATDLAIYTCISTVLSCGRAVCG